MNNEIQEAIDALVDLDDSDLCEELIRNKNIKDPAFAEAAFAHDIFYPAILYKDASTEVRDKLITMLDQNEVHSRNVNGMLIALAVIGDETVVEYFMKWEKNPPAWRKQLHVGPEKYAFEGGWCIEDGKKKELVYEECYALEKKEVCDEDENVFGGTSKDKCPHCNSSYVNYLVVNGRDKRLSFLGIEGKIKIKTCECCLPWEDFIYCKYEEDGESEVIHRVSGDGELAEDDELNKNSAFVISQQPVPKYYCTEWEGNVIGGAPTFIDDANYAVCPKCGKNMRHLAQLTDEFTEYGNVYVQICTNCKIAATSYQQS